MREAMLYETISVNKVKCILCARRCVIPEGSIGFCRVRKNEGGKLYSLVYGKLCSAAVDPIMKKPLYHFHPGSMVLSIATVGCNFNCLFCDNWVISHERDIKGYDMSSEEVVRLALERGCQGISYTYTEPTIFYEFAYDTAKLAHKHGLFNTFVTNGYMTVEAIERIAPYLNAATVDFKGGGDPEFYRKLSAVPSVEPIYEALKEMKRKDIHIEVTNLVVTKYGDSLEGIRRLACWVKTNLGEDAPFHLLRFHPDYRLTDVPSTPIQTLERACEVATREGLYYVYAGNLPGHRYEHTYCPKCHELVIERFGFDVTRWRLGMGNTCPKCGYTVAIKGKYHGGGSSYPLDVF